MNDDVQTVGEMLGAAAGEVMKVAPNGRYMKFYVQVQVMIDPEVPVVAGHFLKLPPWLVQRRPMWVQFRYERVFKLCYICGRIGHKKQGCDLTLEVVERVVFERADEVWRRLGCGVATDYSRRLYTGRVRTHHRGLTWGSRRRSNRVIFFDEEDGMPPVNLADFDDDEDPSLTIHMMQKRVGGGGKVVFERVDIDIEDTYWVKESRSYWRDIRVRR
ncbi:hypothetical protein Vadar_027637 [Vaccinium darrowii]|uniref:Uncharacterized protein n=1 Tax=Vaccinium darrowii TaxID=229202 RepID=A0ACB7XCX0_9ERIC|nr:hypothetical protein Vadar_027637 [Vaccinium darrowii]